MKRDWGLVSRIEACARCTLFEHRTDGDHPVAAQPGRRYKKRGLAVMVDAPTEADFTMGTPLVPTLVRGRWPNAGAKFDTLLEAANIDRDTLLLFTRVRCRAPGGRTADFPDALAQCEAWNAEEVTQYDPGVIVLAGNLALQAKFGKKHKVSRVRGHFLPLDDTWGARVYVPTYHPSAAREVQGDAITGQIVRDLRAARQMTKEVRHGSTV
jgi:uracil-DNA glycosylase family 4